MTGRTTATHLLNVLRGEITKAGEQAEHPAGSNRTKWGKWYGMDGVYYCDIGASWTGAHAGQADIGKFAYCPYHIKHWKSLGQWHRTGPKRGDQVFFDWSGSRTTAEHTGFVEKVLDNGQIQTIEFNTTPGAGGNQSNGGGCYRRIRSTAYVVGYGRPNYLPETAAKPAPKPPTSHAKPKPGTKPAPPIQVDGVLGANTIKALQKVLKVKKVTGKLDKATVKALQKKLGVKADGVIGPTTRKALQRRLGVKQDGVWGPATIKALQRKLNTHKL